MVTYHYPSRKIMAVGRSFSESIPEDDENGEYQGYCHENARKVIFEIN